MMVLYTNVVLSLVLTVCGVFSQQQPGIADILTLLVNSVGGQGLGLPVGQQQTGPVDILTLLATNNGTSQQQPQLANLLALLANNWSGLPQLGQQPNIASVLALLTNETNQISALSTTLLTLLFESLSLTVLTNNRVSDACQTDMIVYIEEIFRGNQWALKMLDATGKPGADLADGMTKFIGSYEECVSINAVSYTTQTAGDPRIRSSFNGKYCSAFFDIPGAPQALFRFGAGYVQLGVCVPDSCANTDVQTLVAIVERLIFNQTVLYPPRVKCRGENEDLGVDVIVCVVILSLLGGLVVVGTLYDVLTLQSKAISDNAEKDVDKNQERPGAVYIVKHTDMENKDVDIIPQTKHIPGILSDGDKGNDVKSARVTERGTLVKSLLAFSIYTNTIKTLNADQSGPLTCINGIRVLTIGWVILGHVYHYAREFDANWVQYVQKSMNNWTSMLPAYSDLAVDTFFAISGLLVSYVMLKKFKSNGGPRRFNWLMFCLHRYLRLTPTYMLVLMIGTVLLPRLLHGPFWEDEAFSSMHYCRDSWWTNVLYINNYVRKDKHMCMGWSWYLSVDLQMYLISPLMIVPLFFNAVWGILFCVVILVAVMVSTGLLVYNRNYPIQPFLFPYFTENVSIDNLRYDIEIYTATHMRIGSYIVGVLTGYFLYRWKCSVKIPKFVNLLGWFLSFSLSLVLIYVRYSYEGDNVFSRLESAIYTSIHRVLWSAVPCWVIFSCATGYGGWINTLLSWKAFVPLSKLTFCVYLVHPLVMMTFYASRMVTTYFTEFELTFGAGYVQLGVCVPDCCADTDIQALVAIVERLIFNQTVLYPPRVKCREEKEDVGVDVIVCVVILSLLGCVVVVGTLYDIFTLQRKAAGAEPKINVNKDEKGPGIVYAIKHTDTQNKDVEIQSETKHNPDVPRSTNKRDDLKSARVLDRGTLVQSLLAFSIYTNIRKTLSADQSGSLTCINGIRVLTIGWIILSHTYYYARTFDANLIQYEVESMNNWTSMLPAYADVGVVDTFLAISGLLVSYIMLKKFKNNGGPRRFNWPMFCLHRYLRLTPTYMLVLMIGTVFLPRLFDGPLWDSEALQEMQNCREKWWTNLLYINNYLRVDTMCMGWSWYLSADIHMYLISPVMIVPLFFNAILGLDLCMACLVAVIVSTGIVAYNGNDTVQTLLFPYFTESWDFNQYYKDLYNPSHMRVGPYIVGIVTGYLLYRWKCSVKIPKILNFLGWFLSISTSLVLIYVRYSYEDDRLFSRLDSAIFMSVHRVLWSAVPCWVIFSCATGHGGWINTLLSWKAFVPLSKLTFCVYLVHPLVMITFYASRMVTTYFTDFELAYLFLAHATMSFGVAFLLSTTFEVPMVRLEKILLYRGKQN